MNENENVGFEDFENALFGGDYQIDNDDGDFEEVETDDTEDGNVIDDSADDDTAHEPAEEPESDEDDSEDKETDPDEGAEESKEEPESGNGEQMFTLKVNKEEKQVTLDEMTALAQKGADYDRVKENYTKSQQNVQDLQAKLDALNAHQSALDILTMVAEKSGASIDQLAESIYVNLRKSAGASEDAAREELKSAKLERELSSYKAQKKQSEDDADSRAKRDMDAFQQEYPDVQLTRDLIQKLTADIQNGMSLSAAYRKFERAQETAKIAELERKLAAKAQNDKNKKQSPGSQKDSGGRRTRSDYEEFERALFG
jgi:hypothetical protein